MDDYIIEEARKRREQQISEKIDEQPISFEFFSQIKDEKGNAKITNIKEFREHFLPQFSNSDEAKSEEIKFTIADIERTSQVLEAIAAKANMTSPDIIKFSEFSQANDTPQIIRPVNPDVPEKRRNGAIGKSFASKPKSATDPLIAAEIPTNAFMSKVGFPGKIPEDDPDAIQKISKTIQKFQKIADKLKDGDFKIADAAQKFATSLNGAEVNKEILSDGTSIYSAEGVEPLTIPPIMASKDLYKFTEDGPVTFKVNNEYFRLDNEEKFTPPEGAEAEHYGVENRKLSSEGFASELQDVLKNRIHIPVHKTNEAGEKLYAFSDPDGLPLKDANGHLATYTITKNAQGEKQYISADGELFTPEFGYEEHPVEIFNYRNFDIKATKTTTIDANGQEIEKTSIDWQEGKPIAITADYDQFTFATKNRNAKDLNTEGITADQVSRSGSGSALEYAVTQGLKVDLDDMVQHNQEHSNPFGESFSKTNREVHMTFRAGPKTDSAESTMMEELQFAAQNNLVATIIKNPDITPEHFEDLLQDFVAFPDSEFEVANQMKEIQQSGYDIFVNDVWLTDPRFNNKLWAEVKDPNIEELTSVNEELSPNEIEVELEKEFHEMYDQIDDEFEVHNITPKQTESLKLNDSELEDIDIDNIFSPEFQEEIESEFTMTVNPMLASTSSVTENKFSTPTKEDHDSRIDSPKSVSELPEEIKESLKESGAKITEFSTNQPNLQESINPNNLATTQNQNIGRG